MGRKRNTVKQVLLIPWVTCLEGNKVTAVRYVFDYLAGYAVFGLFYWLLNGILVEFKSLAGYADVLDVANYFWWGSLIIYMIFATFWLFRALKFWDVVR